MYAIVLLSALYLIVMPLTIGDARFRVPVEPFLALLGGMALVKRPLPVPTVVAEREAAA
jgi:hypothetical protein